MLHISLCVILIKVFSLQMSNKFVEGASQVKSTKSTEKAPQAKSSLYQCSPCGDEDNSQCCDER